MITAPALTISHQITLPFVTYFFHVVMYPDALLEQFARLLGERQIENYPPLASIDPP